MNVLKINKKAFTLVELIILVSILALLAATGYFSVNSYMVDVRDTAKITELNNMNTSLGSYIVKTGFYPDPDEYVEVTYSGSTLWKQGIFGENVASVVGYSKDDITDPKTGSYYTYSIKNTRKEISLAGVLESEDNKLLNTQIISGANAFSANTVDATAVVVGDYNGAVTYAKNGGSDLVFALPSIVASNLSSTDIVDIIDNNRLVYNGFGNLPASYEGTEYIVDKGVDLSAGELVVFSGSLSDLSSESERVLLLYGVKESYINTSIENHFLGSVLNFEINTLNPSRYNANTACDLVKGKLNYDIECEYSNFKAFYVLEDASVLESIDFTPLLGRSINYIFQDTDDNIWFATDEGVYLYNSGPPSSWTIYTTDDGLIYNNVRVVEEDSDGNMWFGTFDGLSRFDGVVFEDYRHNLPNSPELPHKDVYTIVSDDDSGLLYIGTHLGIGIYDPDTEMIDDSIIPPGNGTPNNHTNSIFIDSFGVRWYGTYRGVVRDNGSTTRYDGRHGLPFQDNSGNTNKKKKTYVKVIGEDTINEELWIGTEDGLGRMTKTYPNTIEKYYSSDGSSNLGDDNIHSIYQDPDGNMWFGTDNGVSIFDRDTETFTNYVSDKDGNPLLAVYFIYNADGLTILGTGAGTTTLE